MSSYPRPADVQWRLGFLWQTYSSYHMGIGQPYSSSHRLIVVPYWFLAGVLALPPLAWARGLRRRVGLVDLLFIVAALALTLAVPILLVRSMNQSRADAGEDDRGAKGSVARLSGTRTRWPVLAVLRRPRPAGTIPSRPAGPGWHRDRPA